MNKTVNIRRDFFVCLLLVVATLVCYWQVQDHDFVNFDDDVYVTENPHVRAGLNSESFIWAFTNMRAGYWMPLTWLSHMLDYHLFGSNPGRHHVTGLFFHITNTVLLFLVLKRLTGAFYQSAFVAALFAIHPLNVEPVAWMMERKGVLSTFFLILTMAAYVRYAEQPRLNRYLLVLLLFVFGLMAKPILVTLPFVLLLLDFWPLGRFQFEQSDGINNAQTGGPILAGYQRAPFIRLILEKTPFFILVGIWSFFTFSGHTHLTQLASLELLPIKVRIANALVCYVGYIGKMIWPQKLAVWYPLPGMLPIWKVTGAGLFLICVSMMVNNTARRLPYLAVGWLWYLGMLVPVIGLVQLGSSAMADRYAYIPLIGLFIMVAWGVPELVARWRYRRISLAMSAGVILSALMICTWFQVRHWHNSITLFEHAIDVSVNNNLAHYNLGQALAEQGRLDEAIAHYSEAMRIKPHHPDAYNAHNNIGLALFRLGRLDEAIAHYSEALRIKPDHVKAHNNMGNALANMERLDKAIAHYSEALRIKPDYVRAHNNLGVALVRQGKLDEAIGCFSKALRISPDYADAGYNLKLALRMADKSDKPSNAVKRP